MPGEGASDDEIAAAARRRRDLALEGYAELRAAVHRLGPAALASLHEAATRLARPFAPRWQETWTRTVYPESESTAAALEGLFRGVAPHLARGTVSGVDADPAPRRYGMCGRLQTWPTST